MTDNSSEEPQARLQNQDEASAKSDWLQWRCWPVLSGIVSLSTLLVGAIGLLFVIIQLNLSLKHRKADAALGFVERFNSGVYVTARNEVLKPWLKYQAQLGLAREHGGISKDQINRLTDLIIQQDRASGGNLEGQVLTLVTFFDELAICVESETCDLETSCLYFQKRAQDFDTLYGAALVRLAAAFDLNNSGHGLKFFTESAICESSG